MPSSNTSLDRTFQRSAITRKQQIYIEAKIQKRFLSTIRFRKKYPPRDYD